MHDATLESKFPVLQRAGHWCVALMSGLTAKSSTQFTDLPQRAADCCQK